jgi:hypothetical protein
MQDLNKLTKAQLLQVLSKLKKSTLVKLISVQTGGYNEPGSKNIIRQPLTMNKHKFLSKKNEENNNKTMLNNRIYNNNNVPK